MSSSEPEPSAPFSAEYFELQFDTVRTEILSLIEANERRVLSSVSIVVVGWSLLFSVKLGSSGPPGVAFILPLLLLPPVYDIHVTYSRRVANMSAFLSAAQHSLSPSSISWDAEIGRFARTSGIDLGTKLAVRNVFLGLGAIGIVLASLVSFGSTSQVVHWSRWLDAVLSVGLGLGVAALIVLIDRRGGSFSANRQKSDGYWEARFGRREDAR
jgi:hypothetical protein